MKTQKQVVVQKPDLINEQAHKNTKQNVLKNNYLVISSSEFPYPPSIGTGYKSIELEHLPGATPFKTTPQTIPNPYSGSGEYSLGIYQSKQELIADFEVTLDVDLKKGVFKKKAAQAKSLTNYTLNLTTSETALYIVAQVTIPSKTELVDTSLPPFTNTAQSEMQNNVASFYNNYGDFYLAGMRLGGMLLLTYIIETNDLDQKHTLYQKITGQKGSITGEGTLKSELQSITDEYTASIYAFHNGGLAPPANIDPSSSLKYISDFANNSGPAFIQDYIYHPYAGLNGVTGTWDNYIDPLTRMVDEYADWIEQYNTTHEEIAYFLADKIRFGINSGSAIESDLNKYLDGCRIDALTLIKNYNTSPLNLPSPHTLVQKIPSYYQTKISNYSQSFETHSKVKLNTWYYIESIVNASNNECEWLTTSYKAPIGGNWYAQWGSDKSKAVLHQFYLKNTKSPYLMNGQKIRLWGKEGSGTGETGANSGYWALNHYVADPNLYYYKGGFRSEYFVVERVNNTSNDDDIIHFNESFHLKHWYTGQYVYAINRGGKNYLAIAPSSGTLGEKYEWIIQRIN